MSGETVFVVSDAHLGGVPGAVGGALHEFLDTVPRSGDHVVLNGDLFEFWFEYSRVIPKRAFPTLVRLAGLRDRGVRLTVTGGNHDRWGRDFWREELGAGFHREGVELELAGWRAFVAHGDGIAEQHAAARVLHGLTRHRLTAALFRWIHPDLGHALVERFSGLLGERTRSEGVLEKAASAQEAWARKLLAGRGDLNLVVLGHTHRPMLTAVGERRWYVNPGAWMDGFRYATITDRGPELRTYRLQ